MRKANNEEKNTKNRKVKRTVSPGTGQSERNKYLNNPDDFFFPLKLQSYNVVLSNRLIPYH